MNWEMIFKVGMTGIGGFIGWIFGGWTGLLPILLVLMAIDQISGLLASYNEGKLSSKVGWRGIAKKVMTLCVIIVCNVIDIISHKQGFYNGSVVRDGGIVFYLWNEVLSFIENAGRAGVPLPAQLTNAVEVLKKKGDEK